MARSARLTSAGRSRVSVAWDFVLLSGGWHTVWDELGGHRCARCLRIRRARLIVTALVGLHLFELLLHLHLVTLLLSGLVVKRTLATRTLVHVPPARLDLMDMLVRELKDELEARSESKTGNKAWLRRRLHGAIVRDHLDAAV